MDVAELLALYDQQQRIGIEYPDMRKDVLPYIVRFVRPAPGMSFILYSRLDETNADAAIDEQFAYFKQAGLPFEWKVYDHDTPSDLKDRLLNRGLVAEDPDAIMVLDLSEAPPALLEPVKADVRRLMHRDQIEDVIRVEEQIWGEDFSWMRQRIGDHMDIPGYVSVYVAYVEQQPACAGWTYFDTPGQFASLWGGSTVAEHRGRGLYTGILAARVQEARERGFRFLTIDAGEMSRPIVARHGFRFLTHAHACEWKAPAG